MISYVIFSLPGRSPGRAIVLTPASVLAAASALAKCQSFYVEVLYVIGKVLSGELSCPCDRSCSLVKCALFMQNQEGYVQIV